MNPGQRTLLILIACTAAPFVLAHFAFQYYQGKPVGPTTNKGTLVQPATSLAALQLEALPGPALPTQKWRLLLFRPAVCEQSCMQDVQRLRALPLLLGREGDRIAAALIVEDVRIAASGRDNPAPQLPRFKAAGTVGNYRSGLLLVDPQGNVVLWYDSARIGAPLLADLKFLLKNSSIG